MSITPLPPLVRTSATFRPDVNAFFGGLIQTFSTEANAVAAAIDAALAAPILGVTATSSTSVTIPTPPTSKTFTIETGKGFVPGMEIKISSTASPTNYMRGTVTSYSGSTLIVDITAVGGAGTFAVWSITIYAITIGTIAPIPRVARTANTIFSSVDIGKFIDYTSGTFSQTFTAAATLGDGWWVAVRNVGTGVVTMDPNGSETIDGFTTGVLNPGMIGLILCDGANFHFMRLQGKVIQEVLTSGTSWSRPLGVRMVKRKAGGGGGSGSSVISGVGMSGAAGGYAEGYFQTNNATETYAIGAGGAAVTQGGSAVAGNAGGATTGFGITCNGGQGGKVDTTIATGGTASGGTINIQGGSVIAIGPTSSTNTLAGQSPLGIAGTTAATGTDSVGFSCGGIGHITVASQAGRDGVIILEY